MRNPGTWAAVAIAATLAWTQPSNASGKAGPSKPLLSGKVTVRVSKPVLYTVTGNEAAAVMAIEVRLHNKGRGNVVLERDGTFVLDRNEHSITFPGIRDAKGNDVAERAQVGQGRKAAFTLMFAVNRVFDLSRFDLHCTVSRGVAKDQAIFHYKAEPNRPATAGSAASPSAPSPDPAAAVVMKIAAYRMLKQMMHGDLPGGASPASSPLPWKTFGTRTDTLPFLPMTLNS